MSLINIRTTKSEKGLSVAKLTGLENSVLKLQLFYFIIQKTMPSNAGGAGKAKQITALPSSISGGSPPTNTFLEYLSIRSRSDLGDPFREELNDGTI